MSRSPAAGTRRTSMTRCATVAAAKHGRRRACHPDPRSSLPLRREPSWTPGSDASTAAGPSDAADRRSEASPRQPPGLPGSSRRAPPAGRHASRSGKHQAAAAGSAPAAEDQPGRCRVRAGRDAGTPTCSQPRVCDADRCRGEVPHIRDQRLTT